MSISAEFIPPELHIEVGAERVSGGVSEDCVLGPESATDGNIPVFDGESGKLIKDGYSVASTITDDDASIPTSAAVNSALANLSLIKTTSGIINTNANSVIINYSGTLIKAYAVQGNEIVMVDIVLNTGSITFSVSEKPDIEITCMVIYV